MKRQNKLALDDFPLRQGDGEGNIMQSRIKKSIRKWFSRELHTRVHNLVNRILYSITVNW